MYQNFMDPVILLDKRTVCFILVIMCIKLMEKKLQFTFILSFVLNYFFTRECPKDYPKGPLVHPTFPWSISPCEKSKKLILYFQRY